jgi:hypothetical protein
VKANRGGSDSREQGDEGADRKKALTSARKREVVEYLVGEEGLVVKKVSRCVGLVRAIFYRRLADKSKRDAPAVDV